MPRASKGPRTTSPSWACSRVSHPLIEIRVPVATTMQSAVPLLAAGTLDQQNTNAIAGLLCNGVVPAVGQTFTAGLTGQLDQVDLFAGNPSPSTVTVQLRDAVGNLPGSTVLASTTVALPVTQTFFSVPLSSPAAVVAGTQYAV